MSEIQYRIIIIIIKHVGDVADFLYSSGDRLATSILIFITAAVFLLDTGDVSRVLYMYVVPRSNAAAVSSVCGVVNERE